MSANREVERLREALEQIVSYEIDDHDSVLDALRMQEIAREALAGHGPETGR